MCDVSISRVVVTCRRVTPSKGSGGLTLPPPGWDGVVVGGRRLFWEGPQWDGVYSGPSLPKQANADPSPSEHELGLEALRPDLHPLHRVPGAPNGWPLCGPLSHPGPGLCLTNIRPLPGLSLSSVLPGRSPACPCDPVCRLSAYLWDPGPLAHPTPTCANKYLA